MTKKADRRPPPGGAGAGAPASADPPRGARGESVTRRDYAAVFAELLTRLSPEQAKLALNLRIQSQEALVVLDRLRSKIVPSEVWSTPAELRKEISPYSDVVPTTWRKLDYLIPVLVTREPRGSGHILRLHFPPRADHGQEVADVH